MRSFGTLARWHDEGLRMATDAEHEPGRLLGAIFSASPDAVVVIDDSGTIVLSSPAVTELFGYYPEELVGEPLELLIPATLRDRHQSHVQRFFQAPRARQMGVGLQLAGRHRDGEAFAVDVSLAPVEVRGRRYSAAFVRDARDRQQAIERLHSLNEITQRLLSGAGIGTILSFVAQQARLLSRSDAVWIVAPSTTGELEIRSVDGIGAEVLRGVRLSAETSRSANVMNSGVSEVIEDLAAASNVPSEVIELGLGPGLYVPLVASSRRLGTLVLARLHGMAGYHDLDIAFAEAFASSAAAVLEIGEVREEVDRLEIVAEDERIARDLHDTVIQQLFALGMSLQATRAAVAGQPGERIDAAIDGLDGVIKEIRNTIFRLPARTNGAKGVRDEMLRLADNFKDELGFVPRLLFEGALDLAIPETVQAHLLQVFNEALSNVARHARATNVDASVALEGGWLVLTLVDDGVGIPEKPRGGNGLGNMRTRARDLGGVCTVSPREASGTIVEWRVPLRT
jgi:PAS domain S-box-containing protein